MKNHFSRKMGFIFTASFMLFFGASQVGATSLDSPLGLKGVADPLRRAFTLLWEPVRQNSDGSVQVDLAGYNIYRRDSLRGPAVKINPYVVTIPVFADRIDGGTFYYSVRAVDNLGQESTESFLVDSSLGSNLHFLAEDGLSSVVIPGSLGDLLRSAHNKYGVPLTIKLQEHRDLGASAIVRSLDLKFLRGDTKQEVTDLAFQTPDADIKIGYGLVNGQVSQGDPGTPSFSNSLGGATPDQLCLFWFNGVAWIKLGGTTDTGSQTVSIKSSQLGNYQLRVALKASALALEKQNVFPGLFTPNGDGFNDRVYLVLENPNNASVSGDIFDLAGRRVSSLPPPTYAGGLGTTLTWAGHDDSGSVVPSGLYVYRIEGDGQVLSGTISVAR